MIDLSGALFLAIAVITLAAAWQVVVSVRIMYSALWLGLTFFGVAASFLMLGADFIAAAQVLVYVGAITVLLIFGVMLSGATEVRGQAEDDPLRPRRSKISGVGRSVLPIVVAAGFTVLMVILYHSAGLRILPPEAAVTDTPRMIGRALFDTYIIPFEVAALILLVGLVGAITLATREEE